MDLIDAIRSWIQQNRENVIEEIDSDVVETTINRMREVSTIVQSPWSDITKGRKEKAHIFLDFVLQKDEYVAALKNTMEENGFKFENQLQD